MIHIILGKIIELTFYRPIHSTTVFISFFFFNFFFFLIKIKKKF